MYSYTLTQWLFYFYFYCFFGWCFESTYVSIKDRKLTNRGFMRGPFLPLYGSGGLMMLVVSMPFRDNVFLMFVAGCVGATLLEYVTGVVMEALFKVRYWDYTKNKFNFHGYICLESSLAWGLLTILMTVFLHVPVERMVLSIPNQVLTVVTIVLSVGIGLDFILSFKAAIDLRNLLMKMGRAKKELVQIKKRLESIVTSAGESLGSRKDALVESVEEIKSGIEGMLERLKEMAINKPSAYLESVKGELLELKEKYAANVEFGRRFGGIKDFIQRQLLRGNPSMTSEEYKEELEALKERASRGGSKETAER